MANEVRGAMAKHQIITRFEVLLALNFVASVSTYFLLLIAVEWLFPRLQEVSNSGRLLLSTLVALAHVYPLAGYNDSKMKEAELLVEKLQRRSVEELLVLGVGWGAATCVVSTVGLGLCLYLSPQLPTLGKPLAVGALVWIFILAPIIGFTFLLWGLGLGGGKRK